MAPIRIVLLPILFIIAASLPLDSASTSYAVKFLFYLKIPFLFLGLCLAIQGWGHLLLKGSQILARPFLTENTPEIPEIVRFFATGLFGIIVLGWLNFVIFLFAPPNPIIAWMLLVGGWVLASSTSFTWLTTLRERIGHVWQETWFEKIILITAVILLLCHLLQWSHFQEHGDAYLYHLRMSEIWMHKGTSGLVLDNIYSGYALAVEHFYLWIKLLLVGPAEQNAMAQWIHVLFGWGGMLCFLIYPFRSYLSFIQIICLILILTQVDLSFHLFLPKNDGFAASSVALAWCAFLLRQPALFISTASIAFAIKATTAMLFIALGVVMIIKSAFDRKDPIGMTLKLLLISATTMILAWLPFAWHNYTLTQNPFFPILNEVFKSPFAPTTLAEVVTEMRPFTLTLSSFLQSWYEIICFQNSYLVFFVILFVTILIQRKNFFRQKKDHETQKLFIWNAILAFVLLNILLLGLGPFGHAIEPRHYIVGLAILVILSCVGIVQILRSTSRKWLATALLFVLALSTARLELWILRSWTYLSTPSVTAAILNKKDLLAMNKWITDHIIHDQPRILALTKLNSGYFLPQGDFLHQTMSYPFSMHGPLAQMNPQNLYQLMTEEKVTHLLIESSYASFDLIPQNTLLLQIKGPYHLYHLQDPN